PAQSSQPCASLPWFPKPDGTPSHPSHLRDVPVPALVDARQGNTLGTSLGDTCRVFGATRGVSRTTAKKSPKPHRSTKTRRKRDSSDPPMNRPSAMVRRASTVRVRQRASRRRCKSAVSVLFSLPEAASQVAPRSHRALMRRLSCDPLSSKEGVVDGDGPRGGVEMAQ